MKDLHHAQYMTSLSHEMLTIMTSIMKLPDYISSRMPDLIPIIAGCSSFNVFKRSMTECRTVEIIDQISTYKDFSSSPEPAIRVSAIKLNAEDHMLLEVKIDDLFLTAVWHYKNVPVKNDCAWPFKLHGKCCDLFGINDIPVKKAA